MSGKLMGQVFRLVLPRPEREVLLALADHASDDGRGARPSIALLAWKTDYSERQIKRILKKLKDKGLIMPVAYEKGGHGRATEYQIDLNKGILKPQLITRSKGDIQMSSFHQQKSDKSSTITMTSRGDKGDIQMSSQPPMEPSIEPSLTHNKESVGSKFSKKDIRRFVEHLKSQGHTIRSVGAYSQKLYETGNADDDIGDYLRGEQKRKTIRERMTERHARYLTRKARHKEVRG